jgi:hypothetical protein
LRAALKDYELDINESKTRIISTKYVFGESWPSEFEKAIRESFNPYVEREGSDYQEALTTLGQIVDRATKDNDDGIIRNAIRIMDRKKLWSANWIILEHFLAQCCVQFPHSLDYVARVIAWRVRKNLPVNIPMWIEIAQVSAAQHAAIGRESETCWAIWLLKELGAKPPKSLTDLVLSNTGGLVLAFLAHFQRHRMCSDRKLLEKLRDIVSGDPYAGPFWPLSLELTYLGAGDSTWEQAATLPVLRALHSAQVSIIEWNAPPKVFEEHPPDNGGDSPDYAIEDFGSDYSGDDDNEEEEEDTGEDLQGLNLKQLHDLL